MYFIEHQFLVFIFFTIPFSSWVLHKIFNGKVILYILYSALVLLSPIVSGYTYIVDNVYAVLFYIVLSCGYFFLLIHVKNVVASVVKHSIILLVILGIISFYAGFFGRVTLEKEWELKDYRVQYLREQGFSGGPLFRYELYEYGNIPIFIKYAETKIDSDTTNSCTVRFKYKDFRFNKCIEPIN